MAWRRGKAYSKDVRDQVLAAVGSAQAVGIRLGVSTSYVRKVRRLGQADGAVPPQPSRSRLSPMRSGQSSGEAAT